MIPGSSVGPGPITRDGARHAAQLELSKPIYHQNEPPWPVRLLHWLEHELSRFLDTAGRHAPGGRYGALVALAVVLVLVVLTRWRLGPVRRSGSWSAPVLEERPRSAQEYRSAAEEAAARGGWHDAVVARMRAIAVALEERGILDRRPGRTADEIAVEAGAAQPRCASALAAAARVFDQVVYGDKVAGRADYEVVVAGDAAVAATVTQRTVPA